MNSRTPPKIDPRAIIGAQLNHGRIILHSDLNNFYASVECATNPSLRGHPIAVCGRCEDRHGIVLAKNNLAKQYGVKTAEVIWQAQKKCPGLVLVDADYSKYHKYSCLARQIYNDYTDKVEPFGEDEAWLDITGHSNVKTFPQAKELADEIRSRIFNELGLTVSVGVSYNKIFAKLASDYKKPDATTVFAPEDYTKLIAPLAASEMIFVGKSTEARLSSLGIYTIGDIAGASPIFLKNVLGRCGEQLYCNARGEDTSPVLSEDEYDEIKSIGNSMTAHRDLENNGDVRAMCYLLAEKVASRLRRHGYKCSTLQLSIRESNLKTTEHQKRLCEPTDSASDIATTAYDIFTSVYDWHTTVRSLGIRGTNLSDINCSQQLSIFDYGEEKSREELTKAVDNIRKRFGYTSLQRGIVMCDSKLTGACVKNALASYQK